MATHTVSGQMMLPGDFPGGSRVKDRRPFLGLVPPAETRRLERELRPRPAAWLDWRTGRGVTDTGRAFMTSRYRADVAEIIELAAACGVERVFLTGPRPHAGANDDFRDWCHDVPEGWSSGDHYLERADAPVLRYSDGSARVEIMRSAVWWGGDVVDAELCRAAWGQLAKVIGDRWPGAVLLATPATTGRELIVRTIPPGVVWPTLPSDVAELIRSTAGQGRIELFPVGDDEIPGLVELDGRTMYGALCRDLPGGVPVRGWGEHSYGPYARCRVHATWQVPPDWDHIGILPAKTGDGWRYPATPGEWAEGWIDGAELHLARHWGWDVSVTEHIVWPPSTGAGPLDGWARRLLDLIGRYRARRAPAAALVARALRHVLIDALGALVGREHVVTRSTPIDDIARGMPMDAVDPRIEAGHLVWGERMPARWPEMIHPEWSAAVWARCRVRMLAGPKVAGVPTGALHVPRAQLLAIRTDALYTTEDPGWPDDGAAGRLIRKRHRAGPLPAPRSVADILALRDGAR